MRYFIEFAYDGTNYFGYQIQPNQISVQETLEKALSTILKRKVSITGAGRTDTGVHARQMFAHFDDEPIDSQLTYKLNAFLPKDISVFSIFQVPDDAHARFDAIKRTYKYYIALTRNPFDYIYSYPIYHKKLDVKLMQKCADFLLQVEDFKSFSKLHSDNKTTRCKVDFAKFEEKENQLIFTISADRFLRNMVRAIVGTLIEVGKNKINLEQFQQIILEKNRSKAGTSAPANALFLEKIEYPESIFHGKQLELKSKL